MREGEKTYSLEEIRSGKLAAMCGYIPFLFFISFILKKQNRFAYFHGRQAFVLFLLEIACIIINFLPVIGETIVAFASIIIIIYICVGMLKACMNEAWEMPGISDLAEKINI